MGRGAGGASKIEGVTKHQGLGGKENRTKTSCRLLITHARTNPLTQPTHKKDARLGVGAKLPGQGL